MIILFYVQRMEQLKFGKKIYNYENTYLFDEKKNWNKCLFSILLIKSKHLLIASGDVRTIILNLYDKEIYKIYENVWNLECFR